MKRRTISAAAPEVPSDSLPPTPALPAWKAFVVQFSRETEPNSAVFAGRVEHLSSGRRHHFNSADELVAVLHTLLESITPPSPD